MSNPRSEQPPVSAQELLDVAKVLRDEATEWRSLMTQRDHATSAKLRRGAEENERRAEEYERLAARLATLEQERDELMRALAADANTELAEQRLARVQAEARCTAQAEEIARLIVGQNQNAAEAAVAYGRGCAHTLQQVRVLIEEQIRAFLAQEHTDRANGDDDAGQGYPPFHLQKLLAQFAALQDAPEETPHE